MSPIDNIENPKMKPNVEDVDEEAGMGRDDHSIGSSLRGLNRGLTSGGDSPNFADYLKAQRDLQGQRHLGLRQLKRAQNLRNIDATDLDEDAHGHDDGLMPWYAPPVQRQRWGEDQMLPHVNWGDLFFDLFYVAAAYNMGVMLKSALNEENWLRGIIYYVGTFGPLWSSWEVSMFYESRYMNLDYAHRLFEVVRYLFVSTAVLHVKPIELQSDTKSAETLIFTLAVFGEAFMHFVLCLELYFRGLGDREAIKKHTLVKMKCQQLPLMLVYLAAFVTSVIFYVQPENNDGYAYQKTIFNRGLASDGYDTTPAYGKYASVSEPLWKLSDLPLTLTAFAYMSNIIVTSLRKVIITSGKHGDIRKSYVPNSVDYVIHRYGEWILLMIGEGILSLLIVETVEVRDYYVITTFGILTVILIQILKFESEPQHGKEHAMWQNILSGMCYSYLIQALSMSLIVFGVCYKVFLKSILKDEKKYESSDKTSRVLAATYKISDETSAYVFCMSLALVLVSLELMCLTHGGLTEALRHLVLKTKDGHQNKTGTSPNWPVVIITLFKVVILAFTVTLSQWTTDPAVLTICGCCIVLSLSLTRIFNYFFIHKKEVIQKLSVEVRATARRASDLASELPTAILSETGERVAQSASLGLQTVNSLITSNKRRVSDIEKNSTLTQGNNMSGNSSSKR